VCFTELATLRATNPADNYSVRKHIVIAIFGILLAASLAYVLVDWGPNTIEHHSNGYLAQCYWNGFEKWIDKRAPRFAGTLLS